MAVAVAVLAGLARRSSQPALRTLREAPLELDRLDQQMQQMQLAAERDAGPARRLAGADRAGEHRAARRDRRSSAASAKLAIQGDRAVLTFTGVQGDALRGWLGEARSAARARPIEAQLLKAASGYSGSITVSLGGAS